MTDISISASGPVFDGMAEVEIDRWMASALDDVAQAGFNEVHVKLAEVIRHPTGYYESRVVTDRGQDERTISDHGVVYGPWLEGVGSRNAPATRFPGYHHWRIVRQQLEEQAPEIIRPSLERLVEKLNE